MTMFPDNPYAQPSYDFGQSFGQGAQIGLQLRGLEQGRLLAEMQAAQRAQEFQAEQGRLGQQFDATQTFNRDKLAQDERLRVADDLRAQEQLDLGEAFRRDQLDRVKSNDAAKAAQDLAQQQALKGWGAKLGFTPDEMNVLGAMPAGSAFGLLKDRDKQNAEAKQRETLIARVDDEYNRGVQNTLDTLNSIFDADKITAPQFKLNVEHNLQELARRRDEKKQAIDAGLGFKSYQPMQPAVQEIPQAEIDKQRMATGSEDRKVRAEDRRSIDSELTDIREQLKELELETGAEDQVKALKERRDRLYEQKRKLNKADFGDTWNPTPWTPITPEDPDGADLKPGELKIRDAKGKAVPISAELKKLAVLNSPPGDRAAALAYIINYVKNPPGAAVPTPPRQQQGSRLL